MNPVDLLFPKSCLICSELGMYLCFRCQQNIEYIEKDACFYCDRVSRYGVTHDNCKRPDGLDGVLAITYYTPIMKSIISAFKYRFLHGTIQDIFLGFNPLYMAKFRGATRCLDDVLVIPIPIHRSRKNWRGFNQAELIAECFKNCAPVSTNECLVRRKKTLPQAKTSRRLERILNIQNAFAVKEHPQINVNGRNIVLVDDVITTGNTAKEACKVLKKAGALAVSVWCLSKD